MDDPTLPRELDFLGKNIVITIVLVVFLFIISQFWNSAAMEALQSFLGRKPTWWEDALVAFVLTVILILIMFYVLRITLVSFS